MRLVSICEFSLLDWREKRKTAHPDKDGDTADFCFIQTAIEILNSPTLKSKYDRIYEANTKPPVLGIWKIALTEHDLYYTQESSRVVELKTAVRCLSCVSQYIFQGKKFLTINPSCKCDKDNLISSTLRHVIQLQNKISMSPKYMNIGNEIINIPLLIEYEIKLSNNKVDLATGDVFQFINISNNDYIEGFSRVLKLPWNKTFKYEYNPKNKFINPIRFHEKGIHIQNGKGDFLLFFVIN